MNAHTSVEKTGETSHSSGGIGWKAWLRFVVFTLPILVAPFIAAGTVKWTMAWAYFGVAVLATVISRMIVMRLHPDLLKERAQSLDREDVEGWDRLIIIFLALVGPLSLLIVAGLDKRLGWSPELPLALQLMALVIVLLGSAFGVWAMAANKYFSAVVRIQKDRGQTVVTDGPYRFVRHPSYASGIVSYLVTPIMLGSLWALIPSGLVVVVTVVRTALEDRTLQEGLDGYTEYAQRVCYRLLPGVW